MYFVRGAEMVLLAYVVRDRLGADVERIGLLSGAVGLGALLAMPMAWRAADSLSPVRPIVFSLLATAIPTAALAVVTTTLEASAVLIPVGVGMVVFEVVVVVMVQRITPPRTLGRVFGAVNGASNTGKLAGALVAPLMIAVVGVQASLLVVAIVVVVVGAGAVWPLVRVGRLTAARQRDLAPKVSALRDLAIFEGASGPSLEQIAARLVECELSAGTVVIRQGEPAEDLYIARSGALVAVRDAVVVGDIRTGDWFGEIGLLEERPRTATVTTVEPSTVWQIPGDVFLDALADRLASHESADRSNHP
jgi:hypothetical protein